MGNGQHLYPLVGEPAAGTPVLAAARHRAGYSTDRDCGSVFANDDVGAAQSGLCENGEK